MPSRLIKAHYGCHQGSSRLIRDAIKAHSRLIYLRRDAIKAHSRRIQGAFTRHSRRIKPISALNPLLTHPGRMHRIRSDRVVHIRQVDRLRRARARYGAPELQHRVRERVAELRGREHPAHLWGREGAVVSTCMLGRERRPFRGRCWHSRRGICGDLGGISGVSRREICGDLGRNSTVLISARPLAPCGCGCTARHLPHWPLTRHPTWRRPPWTQSHSDRRRSTRRRPDLSLSNGWTRSGSQV